MPSLFLKVCNVGILYLLVICSIQLKLRNTKFYGVRIMNRNTLLLHVKLNVPVEYYSEYRRVLGRKIKQDKTQIQYYL